MKPTKGLSLVRNSQKISFLYIIKKFGTTYDNKNYCIVPLYGNLKSELSK